MIKRIRDVFFSTAIKHRLIRYAVVALHLNRGTGKEPGFHVATISTSGDSEGNHRVAD